MGLFWRRKGKDQFVTLGLNEPRVEQAPREEVRPQSNSQPNNQIQEAPALLPPLELPAVEPVPTGAGPTPLVEESKPAERPSVTTSPREPARSPLPKGSDPATQPKPVPTRSPFATSVLGLNLSIEELQAQEAALEQEFSARFRRAVAATRETLSERLDTVFQGLKQIDENLLDELEEALIAADIGVATTHHILETVRRGIARKQINDLDALKQAIKNELLRILRASEKQGVASETNVPENVLPYVMMIVGVNGVGKTTTIGKLAQRIKAEGNDVLICAADTFRAAASDQLAIWAERTGVPLIQQKQGTDPAAVLFDSVKAAKARGTDVLIVGTAKGGIAVAIAKELGLPIRYAGIGEKVDDLVVFDPEQYVNSLFN